MSQVHGRMKRLESVISICLLAILALIGVGIFIKQSNYDVSQYGAGTVDVLKQDSKSAFGPASPMARTEAGETSPYGGPEIATESSSLASAPAGFETLSKVEVYNADNLYEKIDGKAPLYTESGFEKLSTQRFASINDANLWMEIYVYDMGNVKNAFSVFSIQRRADIAISKDLDPVYAYKTSNALYFVNGHYYIEVIGSAESNELSNAMAEVCDNLRKKLPVDRVTDIAELGIFPTQDIVPGSYKLYLANAFGFERLTDTFTAKYRAGNETVTAFISKRANSKDAEAIAESYSKFLIENGAAVKNTDNKTLVSKVMDFYGKTEIVFAAGPFVAGIHEADNQQAGERIAEELINKLNSLKNE